ncbi:hypothetical protein [Priestia megaterium]|uniref:hypothetical protein n=1 Tax=Priestia megaterium TaxID=1404 RepID=UPI0012D9EFE2|nr:hypothetical protein [Priestia megaterium]
MMKKLTDVFKGKSEMEKNQEELNLVSATIAELNEKRSKYNVILQGAQLELEIEEDASTKKRIKKLENGIEKVTAGIEEHQKHADELTQAIAEEVEKQRLARIEDAKKALEQQVYEAHRISALKQEMERLFSIYDSKSGLVDTRVLKQLVGLRYDENFNPIDPAHKELMQVASEATRVGKDRAQKEIDEVVKKLKEIVGLK